MRYKTGVAKKIAWPVCAAAAVLLLCGIPTSARESEIFTPRDGRPVMIVAHRGVSKFAPQNTIPATEKAIKMGLDFVEIDVRTTKDGRLVLMHNDSVDGTTDGKGLVKDLTLEEIKKLDAGYKFRQKFKGTRVPTIEEYYAAANGRINTYLDWKDATPEALADAIIKAGAIETTIIYGGSEELRAIKKINPRFMVMTECDSELILRSVESSKLKLDAMASNADDFTPKVAELAHKLGMKTFIDIQTSADNCAGVKKQISIGADAVQTDNPDMVLKCLAPKKTASPQLPGSNHASHPESAGVARETAESLFERFAPEAEDIQYLVTGSYGSLQLARLCADKIAVFTTAYKGVQEWLRERLADKVEIANRCDGGEEIVFEWDRDTAFVPAFCDFVTAVYMEKEDAFGPDAGAEESDIRTRFGKIAAPVSDGSGLRVRAYSDKELVWRFGKESDNARLYRIEYAAAGCN